MRLICLCGVFVCLLVRLVVFSFLFKGFLFVYNLYLGVFCLLGC